MLTQLNLCILSLLCRLFLLLRETGEKCIFLPNMQALVAIYILGKLLSYGPRPHIFFNQGIGRDICVATKWGRIHGYARAREIYISHGSYTKHGSQPNVLTQTLLLRQSSIANTVQDSCHYPCYNSLISMIYYLLALACILILTTPNKYICLRCLHAEGCGYLACALRSSDL